MPVDDQQAALRQVSRALDWFGGMIALSATSVGIELGLFEALRHLGSMPPAALASLLELQPRPVEAWAATLVHHGVLEPVGDDRVRMAPGVDAMVCDRGSLVNLAPSITFHARFLARDFIDLEAFFRDGEPRLPSRHGPALVRNVTEQTAAMHTVFVSAILPELPDMLAVFESEPHVLDAGCGTGNLGIQLSERFPGLRYTGFDSDRLAVAEGTRLVAPSGLSDRIELRHQELGAGMGDAAFDVGLVFLALHEIAPNARLDAMKAVRRALRPGSPLLVLDEFFPDTLSEAANDRSKMGVHFEYMEMLWGSRLATRAETHRLLESAGFDDVRWADVLGGSMVVVIGRAG